MKERRHPSLSVLDRFARSVDVYRLVPRSMLGFYVWQMWHVADWAMQQSDISNAQSIFVSTVYGAFPFLLNFYMQQGNNWMPPGFTAAPGASVAATATAPVAPPLARGN